MVSTGEHTGRAPKDKFVVREPGQRGPRLVGPVNQEIDEAHFLGLRTRLRDHLGSGAIYVIDAFAGAEPANRLSLRLVTESAWHALFARSLFIEPTDEQLAEHRPRGRGPPRAHASPPTRPPTGPAPPTSWSSTSPSSRS